MDQRARDVLGKNVDLLVRTSGKKLAVLVKETEVANGTLGRIRTGETETGVDKLDALASYFGVEPWQLLAPNLGMGLHVATAADDGIVRLAPVSIPDRALRELSPSAWAEGRASRSPGLPPAPEQQTAEAPRPSATAQPRTPNRAASGTHR